MDFLLGLPLVLSATTGAGLIAVFLYRKVLRTDPHHPVYDSPTSRVRPEVSHGNSEPHT